MQNVCWIEHFPFGLDAARLHRLGDPAIRRMRDCGVAKRISLPPNLAGRSALFPLDFPQAVRQLAHHGVRGCTCERVADRFTRSTSSVHVFDRSAGTSDAAGHDSTAAAFEQSGQTGASHAIADPTVVGARFLRWRVPHSTAETPS